MSDVCQELQNIKYQTMLLNHNSKIYETTPNTANIEFFLENEKESNKKKPWRKLSKAIKLKKISKYAEEYCKENDLSVSKIKDLKTYLIECLERKKLQRQKDVVYDIDENEIKMINGLIFNKNTNKFTLRSRDRKSASSSLKYVLNKTKGKTKSKTKGKTNSKSNGKIKNKTKLSKNKKISKSKIDSNLKE